jgi:hypothetical protein
VNQDHARASARHLTDEDLLLEFYGEGSPDERVALRAHLDACDRCRALERELRGVLALVDTEPVPEPPEGFEREMWARLEPQITRNAGAATSNVGAAFRRPFRTFELPRWAFAVGTAVLAIGAFSLGRVWDPPSAPSPEAIADVTDVNERLLRSEVEEYLERSQRALVELVNADDSAPVVPASDRARAADLVADGRLYRRSFENGGDAETRDLLEDVERVLVEIANGSEDETSNDLSGVRMRISNQDLIFRLRVMTAEMRERERRARPTW